MIDYQDRWLAKLSSYFGVKTLSFDENGACHIPMTNITYNVKIDIFISKLAISDCIRVCAKVPVKELTQNMLEKLCVSNITWMPFKLPTYSLSEEKKFIIVSLYFSREDIFNDSEQLIKYLDYGLDEIFNIAYQSLPV